MRFCCLGWPPWGAGCWVLVDSPTRWSSYVNVALTWILWTYFVKQKNYENIFYAALFVQCHLSSCLPIWHCLFVHLLVLIFLNEYQKYAMHLHKPLILEGKNEKSHPLDIRFPSLDFVPEKLK